MGDDVGVAKGSLSLPQRRMQALLQDYDRKHEKGWQTRIAREMSGGNEQEQRRIQPLLNKALLRGSGGIEALNVLIEYFRIDPSYFWDPGEPDVRRYLVRSVKAPPLGTTPALQRFLQTVEGRETTPEERDLLIETSIPGLGGEPSELTYHYLLSAIRSVKREENDGEKEHADTDVRRKR